MSMVDKLKDLVSANIKNRKNKDFFIWYSENDKDFYLIFPYLSGLNLAEKKVEIKNQLKDNEVFSQGKLYITSGTDFTLKRNRWLEL